MYTFFFGGGGGGKGGLCPRSCAKVSNDRQLNSEVIFDIPWTGQSHIFQFRFHA